MINTNPESRSFQIAILAKKHANSEFSELVIGGDLETGSSLQLSGIALIIKHVLNELPDDFFLIDSVSITVGSPIDGVVAR
jgi:hypothetical protein